MPSWLQRPLHTRTPARRPASSSKAPPEHATEVLHGVYLSTEGELLRALLGRDQLMQGIRKARAT